CCGSGRRGGDVRAAMERAAGALTLLAYDVSIKELAEYLGHSNPGFTLRTYTHLVPSSYERAPTGYRRRVRPEVR
ncbi:MAG: hypothetical protein ACRDSH_08215, partial [Pseudonocardiaceae bacterium]